MGYVGTLGTTGYSNTDTPPHSRPRRKRPRVEKGRTRLATVEEGPERTSETKKPRNQIQKKSQRKMEAKGQKNSEKTPH